MAKLGKSVNATTGLTFGFGRRQGRPAVIGAEYDTLRGAQLRTAAVNVDFDPAHDNAKLKELIDFLTSPPDSTVRGPDLLDILVDSKELSATKKPPEPAVAPPPTAPAPAPVAVSHPQRAADGHRHLWPTWLGIGLTAALIPTSAVLIHISPEGTCGKAASECPSIYGTAPIGWASIGVAGGSAAFALGWYLFERKYHPSMSTTAGIVPTHGGAFASLSWSF